MGPFGWFLTGFCVHRWALPDVRSQGGKESFLLSVHLLVSPIFLQSFPSAFRGLLSPGGNAPSQGQVGVGRAGALPRQPLPWFLPPCSFPLDKPRCCVMHA